MTRIFGDEAVGDELAQRGAQLDAVAVGDLARRHGQPDDAVAGAVVVLGRPTAPARRAAAIVDADAAADLGADPLDAALLDEVLEAGAVAVVAVAAVALRVTTASTTSTTRSGATQPERHGQPRVGVVLAGVAHAHAAADVDVVAGDVAGRAGAQVGTMPTSLASTSTLLSPGQATEILNLRGR